MKEFPILFSEKMVRAILEGRKTETRRVLPKPGRCPCLVHKCGHASFGECKEAILNWAKTALKLRFNANLWVRENWAVAKQYDAVKPSELGPRRMTVIYMAGGSCGNGMDEFWEPSPWPSCIEHRPHWMGRIRPAMFMPRWASRINLNVIAIKIQKLNSISDDEARAEGILGNECESGTPFAELKNPTPVQCYANLWESIHGRDSWADNPWVVAIKFEKV